MAVRYVTKYGLTQGILKVDGRLNAEGSMFSYKLPGYWSTQYAHGAGRDFHETLEAYVPKVVEA